MSGETALTDQLKKVLYLGHCIGRSDSSRANYIMGRFPFSPEKMPMLMTEESCWGTAASDRVDLLEETIKSWEKAKQLIGN